MMKIGNYTIDLVDTGSFGLDGGAMFGVVPKALWTRAYTDPDDRNRIPMVSRCLLLRSDERTILVDTGNSPQTPAKQQDIYGMEFTTASLERSLEALGVGVGDVTDVILTHLHFDHAGGAVTQGEHGALAPRFPNAWYHVQREQWEWALAPSEKDRASFVADQFVPLQEHGRLTLLEGPGELFPMIHVDPLFGHTFGMQSVRISDGTTTLFYPADLMPTGAHAPVPYVMAYDCQPLVSIAEKKRILPQIIDEEWIVVFEHDALRSAARIVMGNKGPELRDAFPMA